MTAVDDRTQYLLSEVLWLRSQGVHPVMVAQVLGRDRDSLMLLAKRHGRSDVVAALALDYRVERAWRGNTFDNGQVV